MTGRNVTHPLKNLAHSLNSIKKRHLRNVVTADTANKYHYCTMQIFNFKYYNNCILNFRSQMLIVWGWYSTSFQYEFLSTIHLLLVTLWNSILWEYILRRQVLYWRSHKKLEKQALYISPVKSNFVLYNFFLYFKFNYIKRTSTTTISLYTWCPGTLSCLSKSSGDKYKIRNEE